MIRTESLLSNWVQGQDFTTLHVNPCVQYTDYSFCPIAFKLQMQVIVNERRNPIDFVPSGHRSRLPLALC